MANGEQPAVPSCKPIGSGSGTVASCTAQGFPAISCCLLIVCGIPGAGKTTLSRYLARAGRKQEDSLCFIHIRLDDFYPKDTRAYSSENVAGDFDMKDHRRSVNSCLRRCLVKNSTVQDSTSPETVVSTHYMKTINPHQSKVENSLWRRFILSVNTNCGRPVLDENESFLLGPFTKCVYVIDDNLPLRSMRYEYCQIAREYNLGFATLSLHCHIDIAKKRNAQRSNVIPVATLDAMAGQMEQPDPSKYHWERYSLILNTSSEEELNWCDAVWTDVLQLCQTALSNPFSSFQLEDTAMKDACRKATLASVLHQADQILRQCVSARLKSLREKGCSELSSIAQQANAVRKRILDQLRRREHEWTILQTPLNTEFKLLLEEKFHSLMQ